MGPIRGELGSNPQGDQFIAYGSYNWSVKLRQLLTRAFARSLHVSLITLSAKGGYVGSAANGVSSSLL
jgi:hypothetical protein